MLIINLDCKMLDTTSEYFPLDIWRSAPEQLKGNYYPGFGPDN